MPTASLAEARSHPVEADVFLKHHRHIAEAKREHEDAGTALARAKKSAKNASIDPEAYKFLERLRKLEDDEQTVILDHVLLYAGFLKMPIGTQFSLIDAPKLPKPPKGKGAKVEEAEAEHVEWEAGEAGLLAGRAGEAAESNPYVPGTNLFVAYDKAHRSGQSERATAAGMITEQERGGSKPATPGRRNGRNNGGRDRDLLAGATAH